MTDTRNKSTKARMLRMAATVLCTASLTTAAFADVSKQITVICDDGSKYSINVTCASGTPNAGCVCVNWSSSTGYTDCGHLWTACVSGGGE